MKLYGYYRSSTSYRIRIGLHLKEIGYQTFPVNLKTGEQKSGDYTTMNPFQTLPALDTGKEILVQSMAILEWLDEHFESPSFWPSKKTLVQPCRELYTAIASEVHAPNNMSVLNYLKQHFGADQQALEAWNQTWMHKTFSGIEARLAKLSWEGPLPFGQPTFFEIVLIPQLYNARRWNIDLSAYPLITKVDEVCQNIEAFKRAHPNNQPDTPKDT